MEHFQSPFLVQEGEMSGKNGLMKETLHLDMIEKSSDKYKSADILIFNTGHWWTHEKTSKGYGLCCLSISKEFYVNKLYKFKKFSGKVTIKRVA